RQQLCAWRKNRATQPSWLLGTAADASAGSRERQPKQSWMELDSGLPVHGQGNHPQVDRRTIVPRGVSGIAGSGDRRIFSGGARTGSHGQGLWAEAGEAITKVRVGLPGIQKHRAASIGAAF